MPPDPGPVEKQHFPPASGISLPGSSSAPLLFNPVEEMMEFDEPPIASSSHGKPAMFPSPDIGILSPAESIPTNLPVYNSTRFSDRDSGVNSQENLSEVFDTSSLSCAGNSGNLPDWLNLEAEFFPQN